MCYYEYGKQLVEEKDWFLAGLQFGQIEDYKDSRDYVAMCEAKYAHELLSTKLKPYELLMSDLELTSWEKVFLAKSNEFGELYATAGHFKSEEFNSFTDNDKLTVLEVINNGALLGPSCTITSGDSVYSYMNIDRENHLYKDGEEILVRLIVDSPTMKYLTNDDTCPFCNGSGSVRYNYGSSNLEAILSGNNTFIADTCTSCNGTGKYYTSTKRDDVPKTDAQKAKEGATENSISDEMIQTMFDGFGNAIDGPESVSGTEFEENRESYVLVDATTVQDEIVGEWTMKTDAAFITPVHIGDDHTFTYIAEDGYEFPTLWVFEDNHFIIDINVNSVYEVRKVTDNLFVFYDNFTHENHAQFILYR